MPVGGMESPGTAADIPEGEAADSQGTPDSRNSGVTEIDANVETKLVIVDHTDAVTSQQMLEALKKWSDASGKSVELNED